MILSEKLYTLRTKAGLSQEELAERLNVSRQSVSKWESGSSIPTIDKILELSSVYGVSTDYLLKDELEGLPNEVVPDLYQSDEPRELSLETATEYLSLLRVSAKWIALGVGLCILSPVGMFVLLGLYFAGIGLPSEEAAAGVGIGVLLLFVAVAVLLFILNGMRLEEYDYLEKEEFRLAYGVVGIVEKEAKEFTPRFYQGIACGVTLCVISCVPLVVASAAGAGEATCMFLLALLLVLVAAGVYLIVRTATRKGGYDRLLQQGEFTKEKKQENRRLEVFDTVYWCVMAAIYLGISFVFMNWAVSWILWPVAGVAFAAIRAVVAMVMKKRETAE